MKIENMVGGRIDGENDLIITKPNKPALTLNENRDIEIANMEIVGAINKETVNRAVEKWLKKNNITHKRKRNFSKVKKTAKKYSAPLLFIGFILWLFSDLVGIYINERE